MPPPSRQSIGPTDHHRCYHIFFLGRAAAVAFPVLFPLAEAIVSGEVLLMSQRRRPLQGALVAAFALVAFASSGSTISFADAAGGARSGGGGRGGVHVGVTSPGRSMLGPRSPAVHAGFVGGFRGGFNHQRHHGFGSPTTHHQFQTRSFGFHRFHHRPAVIFNLGGFAYPPYYYYSYPPYYSPIPYYPSYPAFSTPYDPGYSAVNVPYPYDDSAGAYPQPVQSN